MKKKTASRLFPKLALLILAFSAVAVFAARDEMVGRALNILKPEVSVMISGSVKRENETLALDKSTVVKSGELLDWKVISVNRGTAAAHDYRVVGQIPEGTEFVPGSADGENAPRVVYSIDGGKTFSAEPTIEERQPDGSVKKVPAPVNMYSQIRFEWPDDLPVQTERAARYRVRVK